MINGCNIFQFTIHTLIDPTVCLSCSQSTHSTIVNLPNKHYGESNTKWHDLIPSVSPISKPYTNTGGSKGSTQPGTRGDDSRPRECVVPKFAAKVSKRGVASGVVSYEEWQRGFRRDYRGLRYDSVGLELRWFREGGRWCWRKINILIPGDPLVLDTTYDIGLNLSSPAT